jgi:hypothetical protein
MNESSTFVQDLQAPLETLCGLVQHLAARQTLLSEHNRALMRRVELLEAQNAELQRRLDAHSIGLVGVGRWLWKLQYSIADLAFLLPFDMQQVLRNTYFPPFAMNAELRERQTSRKKHRNVTNWEVKG